MATIKTTWTVDIDTALAVGFDYLKIYRSTTGIDGVYSEVSGVGTRPTLAAGVTTYTFNDTGGSTAYFYKATCWDSGTGLESTLSDPVGVSDSSVTVITARKIKVAYLSPEGRQGQWEDFTPGSVLITRESFNANGNRPYVIGTDYHLLVAVLYDDETTGLEEGCNLTGAGVAFTATDRAGTQVFSKTVGAGVTLESQGVKWSDGGTMGVFMVSFVDDETGTPYTAGVHELACTITWSDDDISEPFSGQFEVARIG